MTKYLLVFLFGCITFSSCVSEDDAPPPPLFDLPQWQDNIETLTTTDTTAAAQIDLFVAANDLDTVRTASGLVYVLLDPGGEQKPTINTEIVFWYRGYLVDGSVFDQTVSSPFTALLSDLLLGWQEAIPLLGRGGKIWMLLPPELAYGDAPPAGGRITANSVLIYEVELVDF